MIEEAIVIIIINEHFFVKKIDELSIEKRGYNQS